MRPAHNLAHLTDADVAVLKLEHHLAAAIEAKRLTKLRGPIAEVGFEVIPTPSGSISLYFAHRP